MKSALQKLNVNKLKLSVSLEFLLISVKFSKFFHHDNMLLGI